MTADDRLQSQGLLREGVGKHEVERDGHRLLVEVVLEDLTALGGQKSLWRTMNPVLSDGADWRIVSKFLTTVGAVTMPAPICQSCVSKVPPLARVQLRKVSDSIQRETRA